MCLDDSQQVLEPANPAHSHHPNHKELIDKQRFINNAKTKRRCFLECTSSIQATCHHSFHREQ